MPSAVWAEGSGGETLPLGQSRMMGRVIPVPIPVGMDIPEGCGASLGMLLTSRPSIQGLQSRHHAAPDPALCLGSAGNVASRPETMPGWKGPPWFYGWSWLQPGRQRTGLLCHHLSCGMTGAWLLVPLVLPFTGKFMVSPQPLRLQLVYGRWQWRERGPFCVRASASIFRNTVDTSINRSLGESGRC